jgi:hypothetical protein
MMWLRWMILSMKQFCVVSYGGLGSCGQIGVDFWGFIGHDSVDFLICGHLITPSAPLGIKIGVFWDLFV